MANVLHAEGSEYTANQPEMPGSGGTERFTFMAIGAGSTTLRFEYSRPWESGVSPAQVAEYRVVVQ